MAHASPQVRSTGREYSGVWEPTRHKYVLPPIPHSPSNHCASCVSHRRGIWWQAGEDSDCTFGMLRMEHCCGVIHSVNAPYQRIIHSMPCYRKITMKHVTYGWHCLCCKMTLLPRAHRECALQM